MSSSNADSTCFDHASKLESNANNGGTNQQFENQRLEKLHTAGGHVDDRTQPSLPVVHRSFANPAPLGLLSFATGMFINSIPSPPLPTKSQSKHSLTPTAIGIFLISIYGVQARGIATPNVLVGVLVFFGGVCQFLAGIMEFVAGNTFGATVFPSYGAFNLSYAMIYLPGSGIMASYTDPATGELNAMFPQALAMYVWAWFILTVVFTVAAMRSSWVLVGVLFFLDIDLILLACGYMLNMPNLLKAGNAVGFVVAFLTYWAGTAGLYSNGITPINIPVFPIYKGDS